MAVETVALRDLCEQIVDCPHSTPVWTDAGEIVLRSSNIRNGRLDLSSPSYTDAHHFELRTKRAAPRPGDLVITREAPMGEVCLIPEGVRCCLGQRMVLLRPDPEKTDSRYLLYALQSRSVQHEIGVNEGTGSTVSNLRIPLLEALRIPWRPLPEQRRIADILGTLDDKIELNRRMSQTLEEMARALFKSWFVDFDPVRAKAVGRDTGLPKHLSDIFPDRLVDSDLGELPDGWEVKGLGELAAAERGLSYNGAGLSDSGVPLHNLNSINEGGGFKSEGLKFYTGAFQARHEVYGGDVVVANTEQGHERRLIGFAAQVPEDAPSPSIASHHLYIVRPREGAGVSREFLCSLLNDRAFQDVVSRYANGTTVNMLPPEALTMPRLAVAPTALVSAFSLLRSTVDQRKHALANESRTLHELRDAALKVLIGRESVAAGVGSRE